MNILIVEDEVLSAMFLKHSLEKNKNFSIDLVTTGENAIKYAIENNPEIILMDIKLAGGIDGIEVSEKINLVYQPRIIFITGYQSKELQKETKKIPNSFIIEKPINMKDLLKCIFDSN